MHWTFTCRGGCSDPPAREQAPNDVVTPLHVRADQSTRPYKVTSGALAFLALWFALSGCRCTPALESVVDAPVTVEAAQKLHAPPDVVVTVERKVTPKSSGGCGHSPLCLIILPVLIYEEMFPEKYDEVVIVDHGTETYRGSFSTRGDFLQARTTKDGVVRDLRQLNLRELGRRVVVEAARSPSSGAPPAAVPLAPQADLIDAYSTAMNRPNHSQCGELVVEALSWLGTEAEPLAKAHMSKPDAEWPDKCKAEVAKKVCSKAATPAQLDVIAAAGTTEGGPGPLTTEAVIRLCIAETVWSNDGPVRAPDTLDDAQAAPFTRAWVIGFCTRKVRAMDFKAMAQLSAPWNRTVDVALDAEPACKESGVAEFIRVQRHAPVDAAALDKALTTPWASDIVEILNVNEHEAVLVKALDNRDTTNAALQVLRKEPHGNEKALSTGGVTLANLYVRGVPTSFCVDDEDRIAVLRLMLTLPAAERAAALKVLRDADAKKQDDVISAARRALGDTQPDTFSSGTMYEMRSGTGSVCKDNQVSARALELAGCKPAPEGPRVICSPVKKKEG